MEDNFKVSQSIKLININFTHNKKKKKTKKLN